VITVPASTSVTIIHYHHSCIHTSVSTVSAGQHSLTSYAIRIIIPYLASSNLIL